MGGTRAASRRSTVKSTVLATHRSRCSGWHWARRPLSLSFLTEETERSSWQGCSEVEQKHTMARLLPIVDAREAFLSLEPREMLKGFSCEPCGCARLEGRDWTKQ